MSMQSTLVTGLAVHSHSWKFIQKVKNPRSRAFWSPAGSLVNAWPGLSMCEMHRTKENIAA